MRLLAAFASWLPRALLTLAAIGLLNFTLIRLAPGDPAAVIAGESGAADADDRDERCCGRNQALLTLVWVG